MKKHYKCRKITHTHTDIHMKISHALNNGNEILLNNVCTEKDGLFIVPITFFAFNQFFPLERASCFLL